MAIMRTMYEIMFWYTLVGAIIMCFCLGGLGTLLFYICLGIRTWIRSR